MEQNTGTATIERESTVSGITERQVREALGLRPGQTAVMILAPEGTKVEEAKQLAARALGAPVAAVQGTPPAKVVTLGEAVDVIVTEIKRQLGA